MKLREKTNIQICEENNLKHTFLLNVVEETTTKNKIRATMELVAKIDIFDHKNGFLTTMTSNLPKERNLCLRFREEIDNFVAVFSDDLLHPEYS